MAEAKNVNNRDWDAKGDLLVGTADNAFDQLAVGTNGYGLVADSSAATGLAWGNNSPLFGLAYKSAQYYPCERAGTYFNNVTPTLNRVMAVPFFCRKTTTFDRIAVSQVTNAPATSVMRLGIFNDDGTAYPGTVLLDAGTVATSAGAPATREITISQQLTPGLYWLAAVQQVAGGSGTYFGSPVTGAGVSPAGLPYIISNGAALPGGTSYRDTQSGAFAAFTTTPQRNEECLFVWLRAS